MMNGAGTGALMMGIFTVVSIGAAALSGGTIPFIGLLTSAAIGVTTTSIFGGVMATRRAAEESRSAQHASREASRTPVRAAEQAQAAAPALQNALQSQRRWTETVDRPSGSRDRIAQIIADGSLTDKGRAEAIAASRSNSSGREV